LLLNAEHPLANSYQWQDNSKNATYTVYSKDGQYWVIVKARCNEKGDTINVTHFKNLQVDLGQDLTFCQNDIIYQKLHVKVNPPHVPVSYQWQDGSTLPTYIVEQTGFYSVTVSNICMSASDAIEVKIKDCNVLEIWIPNSFTPDGDGINDLFMTTINNPEYLKEYELTVYDRWGKLIFITQDYLSGWNGKNHKNKECSAGVYTAVIKYKNSNNQDFIKRTAITLLK
jgi:gliding motility-associated-like protein